MWVVEDHNAQFDRSIIKLSTIIFQLFIFIQITAMEYWKVINGESDQKYQCRWPGAECSVTTATFSRLKQHMTDKHNAMETICPYCRPRYPRFSRTDDLMKHLKNFHPEKPGSISEVRFYATTPSALWKYSGQPSPKSQKTITDAMTAWREHGNTEFNIPYSCDTPSVNGDMSDIEECTSTEGETHPPQPKKTRLQHPGTKLRPPTPSDGRIDLSDATIGRRLSKGREAVTDLKSYITCSKLPSFMTYSDHRTDHRTLIERVNGYPPDLRKFIDDLTVHAIRLEDGRCPVVEVVYENFDSCGLYQVSLKPSFSGTSARGLFFAQSRLSQQKRRWEVRMNSSRGALQEGKLLAIWKRVLPDMIGTSPSDVMRVQYFSDVTIIKEDRRQCDQAIQCELTMPSGVPRFSNQFATPAQHLATPVPLAQRMEMFGCYPLIPAGRRKWENVECRSIPVETREFEWPPRQWQDLSSSHRLWAAKTVIALREMKRNDGQFPDGDIAEYIDKYRCLLLPNTQKVRREGGQEVRRIQGLREVAQSALKSDTDALLAGDAEVVEALQQQLRRQATRRNFATWMGDDLFRFIEDVPLASAEDDEKEKEKESGTAHRNEKEESD